MPEIFAAALWGGFIALLLIRAFNQYRSFPSLERVEQECADLPRVTFIVPARNESRNIARCLRGLLSQRYPASRFDVVVVNDGSIDNTAEIVTGFIRTAPNLHLIDAEALPAGWTGKNHACWTGASSEFATNADWLCFVDADTFAEPDFLPASIAFGESAGRAMYSICPFQELHSPWERMFFPVGFMMIAFFQDLRDANDPHEDTAAANGQCLLIRRTAYMQAGGHAAVSDEVCEDTALALHMKTTGHPFAIVGGERFIRTHMYGGLSELYEGLAKNIVQTLGGYAHTLLAIAIAITLTAGSIGMPLWTGLTLRGTPMSIAAFAVSLLASAALLATYIRAAQYFRVPVWYGLLFPIGYGLGIAIAIRGITSLLSGEVAWKGRTIYRQPPVRARFSSILRVASRIRVTWERR